VRSRLRYLVLQRWLVRLALGAVAALLLPWLYLQCDARTLAGMRVAGEALPRSRDPSQYLAPRAAAWGLATVSIVTGRHITTASRAELGARLDVPLMAARVQAVGHSGNPLFDLGALWRSLGKGHDLAWPPRVDRVQISRYMRAIRNSVERPPVAGTIDHAGFAMAGVPGVTLDTIQTAELLERMLRAGKLELSVPLREVAAPQIEIGSPDGIDEHEHDHEHEPIAGAQLPPTAAGSVAQYSAQLAAAAPHAYLPTQGCEAMDPPYERFCQGPRQVALPFGEAAELADRLDLGTIQTVGHLLNAGPRREWIAAGGGPQPARANLGWPVPAATLWRRFGYTRKPPFENLLHRGIDLGAPKGTPLLAVNPGIVAYSDNKVRGYGNLLVIVHDDGGVSFSAHCRAIYVFPGQQVRRGQVVGEVGDTGLARGAHVHWEYHLEGKAIDPSGRFVGG
jgi:hypothetical protein